jgi:hypothetical protein
LGPESRAGEAAQQRRRWEKARNNDRKRKQAHTRIRKSKYSASKNEAKRRPNADQNTSNRLRKGCGWLGVGGNLVEFTCEQQLSLRAD